MYSLTRSVIDSQLAKTQIKVKNDVSLIKKYFNRSLYKNGRYEVLSKKMRIVSLIIMPFYEQLHH